MHELVRMSALTRTGNVALKSRAARRWGDWSILEFPTPVLWLDYGWQPILPDEPDEFVAPVLVELWP